MEVACPPVKMWAQTQGMQCSRNLVVQKRPCDRSRQDVLPADTRESEAGPEIAVFITRVLVDTPGLWTSSERTRSSVGDNVVVLDDDHLVEISKAATQ